MEPFLKAPLSNASRTTWVSRAASGDCEFSLTAIAGEVDDFSFLQTDGSKNLVDRQHF